MVKRIILVSLIAIVSPDAGLLVAQGDRLEPGDRIRVTFTSPPSLRLEGRLERWTPDTIGIEVAPSRVRAAAWPTVSQVEVGRPRTAGQGALRGLGWGALAGAATGAAILLGSDAIGSDRAPLVLGLLGAGMGILIGSLAPGERWEQVPLEAETGRQPPRS